MTTLHPGQPVTVGIIGAGRMGSFHAETLARRLPGTRLAAFWRRSSTTSTRCASSTPAPSRSRYSPWPMR
jgi:predicted homoserine dehydrogenase-like protein